MAETVEPASSIGSDFEILIEAGHGNRSYWRDLFRYRGLFLFLAWRDVVVLYKQTAIGIAWAVLRPLFTMMVLTVVFGRIAGLPSHGTPYPILVFAAMIPWQSFASALTDSSASLVTNANLITKIYFPRLLVPASAIAATVVDLAIGVVFLFGLMIFFHVYPTWRIATLPVFAALGLTIAFGAGTWFSALSVKYRDFRYVVPFVVQLGLYVSPVGFSTDVVPARFRTLYSLNPMVGVIDGFRWAVTGGAITFDPFSLAASVAIALVLCVSGFFYFRSVERTLADVI